MWCAQREEGQATTLYVLPWGQNWPLKENSSANSLCFQLNSSRVLLTTARDSHTEPPPPLSLSLSLCLLLSCSTVANIPFLVLSESCLQSTCATCPWQVKRIFLCRGWVAASTVQTPPSLFTPPCAPVYFPLLLSQYWVAGVKGGQRNLITVTVGLFWHCSWSCADTHRAVCSL